MRRLLIGLGAFFFLLVTFVLAVPFFLPKDAIKQQVVSVVENQLGWRLRLDGPVSLSLLPGFSLTAENVGLSGEAGADGIEFAKAEAVNFGLAWEGLFGGEIRLTGIELRKPDIFLEIGPSGTTSWQPRRRFDETESPDTSSAQTAETPAPSAPESDEPPATREAGFIKKIGVDRFEISQGNVVYSNRQTGEKLELKALDLTVSAPDLEGDVDLDGKFVWQDNPVAVAGSITAPLSFVGGEDVPVSLKVSSGDASFAVSGKAGLNPAQADVTISASGPSVSQLAALFGKPLPRDPGSFSMEGKLAGNEAAFSLSDLQATVGSFDLGGSFDADLAGQFPALSGRMVLDKGSLADLLALAGQDLAASGNLKADLAFTASGVDAPELLASLNLKGDAHLDGGEVSGLGLASVAGGDPAADTIKDISLSLNVDGLDGPLALNGGMSWRGEGFTVTGKATPAPLLAGIAAPVSAQIKGQRFSAGFDGRIQSRGDLEGALSLETADLRSLLAWVGQPVSAGSGLKTFKVSGLFSAQDNGIGFEETSFVLDKTSGRAKGRVTFGQVPTVTANLDLGTLVLDPYLGGEAASSGSNGGKTSGGGGNGGSSGSGGGWSTAPIDFSGLKAVNADFSVTSKEIVWDQLRIGNSVLKTTIKNGVLIADLQKLSLYEGKATGKVTLNGAGTAAGVKASFHLENLDAHPFLRDAADTRWLHGRAFMDMDLAAVGGSERQLVENLNGTARVEFADGSLRGINIPQIVRGLSVKTLLGWAESSEEKTDFSSMSANFKIANGIAVTDDFSLIGPLVRVSGGGSTNMPERTLDWRVEPKIVPTLEGQAPAPRAKGEDKKLAGLGVPVIAKGPWDNPRIYPDIAGILENPEAAYKQLQSIGGDLVKSLKDKKPDDALADVANEAIKRATGGKTQIDIQKVIEGDVNDQDVLKAVEEGFGLPSGLLGSFGKKKKDE
ncbi:AsmA family protein [Roseibium aggregatum]|uniref:AsmA family protein n=1 Tax=Roseibium aggregatum TaxID=187304 RepID=A0A926S4U9_9HYPH|nr:AsmA family protein [Roseibium aggregatum]MBD1546788.1 AsmA family protein [Roseibium aggregatum]